MVIEVVLIVLCDVVQKGVNVMGLFIVVVWVGVMMGEWVVVMCEVYGEYCGLIGVFLVLLNCIEGLELICVVVDVVSVWLGW